MGKSKERGREVDSSLPFELRVDYDVSREIARAAGNIDPKVLLAPRPVRKLRLNLPKIPKK
ncbi:MAG: hypothetical protein G01um10145_911 [Microgenomates group bacterium Gr01-1014_5]|nr:MAG: hypothetical protein G01um10145_911 [Microgenomates group bacterium Gr01-1014_5]